MKPEDIPELEEGFDSRIKFPVENPLDPLPVNEDPDVEELDDDETEVRSSLMSY